MSKKRLLVVEDSKPIALVIERMALSLGYKVTIAHSFAVVKQLLAQKHNFFAATVDYGLPDAPEGQVVPYIIENGIPAIIMTGRMDDATHQKLLNFPIVDYITKENAQAYHYLLRILHGQLTNHTIGVLVVDDSLTSRNHVKQLLTRRNFSVYSVADGTKALQVLAQQKDIKLVITDHEMPGMDGIELVQKIRKLYSRNEMIIMGVSGAKSHYQSARFIKNGADDFLSKPFCQEEFYCRLLQHIEKLQYIAQVKTSAETDYVTGIYNRRHFIELGTQQLKTASSVELVKVLAVIHIDDFKTINDNYQHQVGDEVLIAFSALLKAHFQEQAIVARLSGAEFSVLATGDDANNIEQQLKSLQEKVAHTPVQQASVSVNYTVSVGGVVVDSEQEFQAALASAVELLKKASCQGKSQLLVEGFINLD